MIQDDVRNNRDKPPETPQPQKSDHHMSAPEAAAIPVMSALYSHWLYAEWQ